MDILKKRTNKKKFIEGFDKRITLYEENLRFFKGIIELIKYMDGIEEKSLNVGEKDFIKKFKDESLNGSFDKIISVCSLSIISKIDLYIISKHLLLSKYSWEKFYFLRVAFLNIYETINTYNKYNKELKRISENKNHLRISFEKLGKKLREFKKNNSFDIQMNNIRNSTIGHIGLDFDKYFNDVKSIDINLTIEMIKNFISILDDIYDFSIECLLNKSISKSEKIDMENDIEETYKNLKRLFNENII